MRLQRDAWLMGIAHEVAKRGTCGRAQVGAIIVRDSRLISTGYNGVPARMTHCDHRCTCTAENPGSGPAGYVAHATWCRSLPGCTLAVHAEANAIVFAARHGAPVHGCEMFTTHQPCLECAKLIINAGIVRLVFDVPYRRPEGLDLLNASSVATMRVTQWG